MNKYTYNSIKCHIYTTYLTKASKNTVSNRKNRENDTPTYPVTSSLNASSAESYDRQKVLIGYNKHFRGLENLYVHLAQGLAVLQSE